jgi:hypothetical protein
VILRRIARPFALLAVVTGVGALGLACPAKDLDIAIRPSGMAFLTLSCVQPQACTGKSKLLCDKNIKTCEWDGAVCRGACRIPGNAPPFLNGHLDLQVLLFSSNPANLKKSSKCVAVPFCGSEEPDCARTSIDAAITESLSSSPELTFDGFDDPSAGFAALAIFERPATSDGSEPPKCTPASLIACAGLDVPLNEDKLDIECSSCQNGARTAFGENTRPCPANLLSAKGCFLRTCYAAIGGNDDPDAGL